MLIAPKLPELTGEVAGSAIAHFEDMTHRPLVIIGNGPSASFPRYDALPEDPVIFRMNWFFLESHYLYGRRADAYFWSVYNKKLHQQLFETLQEGTYDVNAFFAPFKVPEDGPDVFHVYGRSFSPQFDHWALISRNPRLARFMMSRPLPTQGFQALACALELGFTDITLIGLDLYDKDRPRYGYTIPETVREGLADKDVAAGYENNHELAHDLAFLSAIRTEYPDARIRAVNCHPLMDPALNEALHIEDGPAAEESGAEDKPCQRTIQRWFEPKSPVPGGWYKEIEGRRCAYVTLCTGDFHWGVSALANSLRAVSDVPLIVVTDKATEISRFAGLDVPIVTVEGISNPSDKMARFRDTYTKLSVFAFEQWDRLVFLDADTIVMQNIDDLFLKDGFCAAPDIGMGLNVSTFNSGVFKFDPSIELFDRMIARIGEIESYDGGDQGFLNIFFADWSSLDPAYNSLRRVYDHMPSLFDLNAIKVLHFVGPKPWHAMERRNNAYKFLDDLWFSQLSRTQLIALCGYLRASPIRAKDARFAQLAYDDTGLVPSATAPIAAQATKKADAPRLQPTTEQGFQPARPNWTGQQVALQPFGAPGLQARMTAWWLGQSVDKSLQPARLREALGLDRSTDLAVLWFAVRRFSSAGDMATWLAVARRFVEVGDRGAERDRVRALVADRLVRINLPASVPALREELASFAADIGAAAIYPQLSDRGRALRFLIGLGVTHAGAAVFDELLIAFDDPAEAALSVARRADSILQKGEIEVATVARLRERVAGYHEARRRIDQVLETRA